MNDRGLKIEGEIELIWVLNEEEVKKQEREKLLHQLNALNEEISSLEKM